MRSWGEHRTIDCSSFLSAPGNSFPTKACCIPSLSSTLACSTTSAAKVKSHGGEVCADGSSALVFAA